MPSIRSCPKLPVVSKSVGHFVGRGISSAKHLMYWSFEADKPFMSGNATRKSTETSSITPAPQPGARWRSRAIVRGQRFRGGQML